MANLALQCGARSPGVVAWGDSLTANGTTPWPTQFNALYPTARVVTNKGVPGETSAQIATRLLAAPESILRDTTIIWAGRNNLGFPATIKADIASMVAALGHTRYLVLSVTNGDFPQEYAGQSVYNAMIAMSNDLAALYGSRYVDVRAMLVAAYNPQIAQDVIDFGHDIPPSSLRVDSIHLTDPGYAIVAAAVKARLATFGW